MRTIYRLLGFCLLLNLAAAGAFADDEWQGITPEDMGISVEEFQKVKESGMSRTKFLKLLELGISPNEYFSEPWKKLGVSEEHWINEKKAGMADDDIDRSYRKHDANNMTPFISFVLPGFYQYKTSRLAFGLTLSAVTVAGIALTFIHPNEETNSIRPYYPGAALISMLVSAGDAYLGTRYVDNQEAQRFSWDIGINPAGGPVALLSLNF